MSALRPPSRSVSIPAKLAMSLVALVAFALPVAGIAAPAAAAPGKPRILAPKAGALITGGKVKVRIRAGGPRPRLIVGNRDVSRRLHRARGGTLVATLRRGKQLRRGTNRIVASSGRGSKRRFIARTIIVGVRKPGSLQVRRRLRSRAAVRLHLSRSPRIDFKHVSVRLNGRRVRTRDWIPGTTTPSTRWPLGRRRFDAMLGADDGLRFGRNRLVVTAWSDDGFYGRVARTVKVGQRAPLVGGHGGRRARVGHKIVLDGSSTRPAAGKRVVFDWRIVRRPKGSHARLHGAHTAHPWLRPDRNGSYRVRLLAHHAGAAAARKRAVGAATASAAAPAAPNALDELTVEATPALPPIGAPIQTITANGSIEVLGRQYPAEPGAWAQVLTLNRNTLEVEGNQSISLPVEHLREAIEAANPNQLLIVSGGDRAVTLSGGSVQSSPQELVAGYLEEIGVISHPAASFWMGTLSRTLAEGRWSAIGVPGGAESGTADLYGMIYGAEAGAGSQPGALTGYLEQDNHGHFKFVSSASSTINTNLPGSPAGTNRIQIGESIYTAQLASGQSGFQVVVLDSMLQPTTQHTFVTNTSQGYEPKGVLELQEFLTNISSPNLATPGYLVVMQSIGEPKGFGPEWVDDGPLVSSSYGSDWYERVPREHSTWYAPHGVGISLAAAVGELAGPIAHDRIAQMSGGSPGPAPGAPGGFSLVASVGQVYASVSPDPGSVAQARSQSPAEARIVGELSRDRQSLWAVEDPAYDPDYKIPKLREYMFQPPTPWPLSETPEQDAANEYIARQVIGGVSDMRVAYYEKSSLNWSTIKSEIEEVEYPGISKGFDKATFSAMRKQLAREAGYVSQVWKLVEGWREIFSSGTTLGHIDMQTIAANISTEIEGLSNSSEAEAMSDYVVSDSLWLAASLPIPAVSEAFDVMAASFSLAGDLASNSEGGSLLAPVRTAVNSMGEELALNFEELTSGVDRAGAILVSDWGKLQAAAKAAKGPWAFNYKEPGAVTEALVNSSNIEVQAALLSTVYQIYVVNPPWVAGTESRPKPWNIDCTTPTNEENGHFFGDEESEPLSWVALPAGINATERPGYELIWYGLTTRGDMASEGAVDDVAQIMPAAHGEKLFNAPNSSGQPGLGADRLQFFADPRFERHWFWCKAK